MPRIIGIDPGSRITGYGIIEVGGARARYLASGCIRVGPGPLPARLKVIFDSVCQLVGEFAPEQMAVEQVFMHRNADSALKLGQARGAAICAGVTHALEVSEYSPREVKQALVGTGGAAKAQVQHMIRALLQLSECPQADAADALAVAVCHHNTRCGLAAVPGANGKRRGRMR